MNNVTKETPMYDLVYVVGGRVQEVVMQNKPIYLCRWKKNQIKNTSHRSGLLQERKVTNRPKTGWL